jgi:hypothetical protein
MDALVAKLCDSGKQYIAMPSPYSAGVPAPDPTKILADNVTRLMKDRGDNQTTVSERGGISKRSVGYVVSYGTTHKTAPTLRTVQGLAEAFALPSWLLFIPNLPVASTVGHELATLVENFLRAPDDGRRNVLRVAESELRYASLSADVEPSRAAR